MHRQETSGFTPMLTGPAGNGRRSTPQDVEMLKTAMRMLGRYPAGRECHGIIDRELDTAIRGYQRDRGLKQDGWLRPGGETERCLCLDLACFDEEDADG